jgi:hypothetical protein
LLSLLPDEVPLPPEAEWIIDLTSYAVALRHPGDYEDVSVEQYREALAAARTVVVWAERILHAA